MGVLSTAFSTQQHATGSVLDQWLKYGVQQLSSFGTSGKTHSPYAKSENLMLKSSENIMPIYDS